MLAFRILPTVLVTSYPVHHKLVYHAYYCWVHHATWCLLMWRTGSILQYSYLPYYIPLLIRPTPTYRYTPLLITPPRTVQHNVTPISYSSTPTVLDSEEAMYNWMRCRVYIIKCFFYFVSYGHRWHPNISMFKNFLRPQFPTYSPAATVCYFVILLFVFLQKS